MMNKEGSTKWWLWSVASPRGVFFTASPSRGSDVARGLLQDFDGILMADGYIAYASLAKEAANEPLPLTDSRLWHPRFTLANCWMHARRPFFRASKDDDEAHVILDLIAELYAIESQAEVEAGSDTKALIDTRRRLRETAARAVIEQIDTWRRGVLALPGTDLAAGLRYLDNQWIGLTRFLENPAIPLDN
jgi:transposase